MTHRFRIDDVLRHSPDGKFGKVIGFGQNCSTLSYEVAVFLDGNASKGGLRSSIWEESDVKLESGLPIE